ncbi:hypothetical protein B0H17DRAFT_1213272 [Mycena rosella]|uniref:Uncharacterized protein n=1 Tax=Mycena rosella TaxID=1033263 RepID=A0AAD7CQG9_MYCRO|nr:hypothetical protein B0H17DRAFT_1213272 [Mycena rosella]
MPPTVPPKISIRGRGHPRLPTNKDKEATPDAPDATDDPEDDLPKNGKADKTYKANNARHVARSSPKTRARSRGEERDEEEEEVEAEGGGQGEVRADKGEEGNGRPMKCTSQWLDFTIDMDLLKAVTDDRNDDVKDDLLSEGEKGPIYDENGSVVYDGPQMVFDDEDEDDAEDQENGKMVLRTPSVQPSSPIQHAKRKQTMPARKKSERIASRYKSASRECTSNRPLVRKRQPTMGEPKTPRPLAKKSKAAQAPKAISVEEGDNALASANPAAKKKKARRVSFSEPSPMVVSTPSAPGTPYNLHFPPLSPNTPCRRRPLRSPDSIDDSIDFDPATGKVTLMREQLIKLVASGPSANMSKLTRSQVDPEAHALREAQTNGQRAIGLGLARLLPSPCPRTEGGS